MACGKIVQQMEFGRNSLGSSLASSNTCFDTLSIFLSNLSLLEDSQGDATLEHRVPFSGLFHQCENSSFFLILIILLFLCKFNFSEVLGIKPRVSRLLGRHFTTELHTPTPILPCTQQEISKITPLVLHVTMYYN